jgi:hypothetical protein
MSDDNSKPTEFHPEKNFVTPLGVPNYFVRENMLPHDRVSANPMLRTVVLRHPIECNNAVFPEGSKGTIVHVYADGEHYEVEFTEPFPCTITLQHGDIRE